MNFDIILNHSFYWNFPYFEEHFLYRDSLVNSIFFTIKIKLLWKPLPNFFCLLISWSVWRWARSLHKKYTHFYSSCYNLPIYFLEQWFFSVQGEMCSLKKNIFNILVEFYITKLLFIIKGTENKTMNSCWERGSKCFRNTAQ